MRQITSIIGAAAAIALLAGCADGGMYGPGPGVAVVGYDGYYDDAYGPFYDGYWGGDGAFYYRNSENDRFHRDTSQHFRRDAANGFHAVHGRPHAGADRHHPE